MTKRIGQVLWPMLLIAAAATAGYWLLCTTFMIYDDEGYVQWSLQNFIRHGHLYGDVYSQYGPFFFVYHEAIARLTGITFNNDTGRLITLVHWLGACLACAALTARLSGSRVLAASAGVLTFTYTWVMISEPSHPGSLLSFLAALLAAYGVFAIRNEKPARLAIMIGLLGAAMTLIKINVGAFAVITGATWLLCNAEAPRLRRVGLWIAAGLSVLVPYALMRGQIQEPWVATFALTSAAANLALVLEFNRLCAKAISPRHLAVFALSGIGLTVVVLAWTMLRGSSGLDLFEGIIAAPFQHPGTYRVPVRWLPGSAMIALVSLMMAATISRRPPQHIVANVIVAGARLILTIGFIVCSVWEFAPLSAARYGLTLVVPFAWLFVHPLGHGSEDNGVRPRLWLAWVLVWQSLHAFPVAGSQINWGTFLAVPLILVGTWEAVQFFAGRQRPSTVWWSRFSVTALGISALLAFTSLATKGYERFRHSRPLDLPGATLVRPPESLSSALRVIAHNLHAHADTVYSLPGMYSFNTWTDRPTPTLANATHWWSLLHGDRQEEIIARLDADPRSAVVVQRIVTGFLTATGFQPDGPLVRYISANFSPFVQIDSYEIWFKRDRRVALFGVGLIDPNRDGYRHLTLINDAYDASATRLEIRPAEQPNLILLAMPLNTSAFPPPSASIWTFPPIPDGSTSIH